MSRSTRAFLLVVYLMLILVFTGPLILREVQGRPLPQLMPPGVATMLLAVNLLPVLLLVVTGISAANEWLAVFCLPPLMAIQLWPLLMVALHPAFVASPGGRAWVAVYSALWVGFVLLVWLYFAFFWPGG
jgi:hypothetical protein